MRRITTPLAIFAVLACPLRLDWTADSARGCSEAGFALRFEVGSAHGQDPPTTLSPGSSAPPAPPAPAPQPAPNPGPVILQVPSQGEGEGEDAEDESGFYYSDDQNRGERTSSATFGPVPPLHVIRRGDTLWDICFFYFNNPFEWPKVWSYNPSITNPHWIYPGDLVRLYPRALSPAVPDAIDPDTSSTDEPDPGDPDTVQPTPARRYSVALRQIAFIERDTLDFAATIVASVEEKTLLSLGDAVYLDYSNKRPPKIGQRYAIYTDVTPVTHPDTGKVVGAYVRILGELEVVTVKKDKRSRAIITDSVDVIERGSRVGSLRRTFRTVEPRLNKIDLQGTIVAMLGTDQIIGQGQLIFVDRGSSDGLEVGNRMFVVRRGDALELIMKPESNVGKDDRRFPARAVGEIIVVQAGKSVSVGLVTLALRAIGIGDKVLMRKARQ